MQNLLNVHDVSEAINVSPDTIRRWDKKGLIKATRSEQNHRLFSVLEIKRLQEKISGTNKGEKFKTEIIP